MILLTGGAGYIGSVAVRELYYSQYSDGPYQTAMVTDGKWKFCWTQEEIGRAHV
jgi:UDP-glucose 4-epimerase